MKVITETARNHKVRYPRFNNIIPCLYIQPTATIVAMTTSIPPTDIATYMYIYSKVVACPRNKRVRRNMLVS